MSHPISKNRALRRLVGRPIMAAADFQSASVKLLATGRAALEGSCRLIARPTRRASAEVVA